MIKENKNKIFIDKNLNGNIKHKINSYYYKNIDIKKINKINNELQMIAQKHKIKMLYKKDFQCDMNNKICFGVTDEVMKSHYDYGHFTLEGAKFFGKRASEIKWLKNLDFDFLNIKNNK